MMTSKERRAWTFVAVAWLPVALCMLIVVDPFGARDYSDSLLRRVGWLLDYRAVEVVIVLLLPLLAGVVRLAWLRFVR